MTEVELPDGSIAEFPDSMTEEEIGSVLKGHFKESKDTFKAGMPGPGNPIGTLVAAKQVAPNLLPSLKEFGKATAFPFMHPIETAKSIGNLGKGAYQKFTPGVQDSEKYVDAVGDFFKDRFGGYENIQHTMINDPIGSLADMSAALTGGAALLPKTSSVTKAINPATAALNATRKGLGKLVPDDMPVNMMNSSVKWNTTTPAKTRNAMSNTMLDEAIMPTYEGTNKAAKKIYQLNSEIDGIIDGATASGKTVKTAELLKNVQQGIEKIDVPEQPESLKMLNAYKAKVTSYLDDWDRLGVEELTPRQVQQFKKNLYTHINFQNLDKGSQVASAGEDAARRAMASGARESIEGLDPSIPSINAREGKLLELMNELPRKASRIENRNAIPLSLGTTGGLGAAADYMLGMPGVGTVLGVGGTVLDMPRPKAHNAIMLRNMQNATMLDSPYYWTSQGAYNLGRLED